MTDISRLPAPQLEVWEWQQQGSCRAYDPSLFFRPPYVGHRGWLGVLLDVEPDWSEMAAICADAYRQIAPKTLVAELDARPEEDAR